MGRVQTVDVNGIRAVNLSSQPKSQENRLVNLIHIPVVILIINIVKGKQFIGRTVIFRHGKYHGFHTGLWIYINLLLRISLIYKIFNFIPFIDT